MIFLGGKTLKSFLQTGWHTQDIFRPSGRQTKQQKHTVHCLMLIKVSIVKGGRTGAEDFWRLTPLAPSVPQQDQPFFLPSCCEKEYTRAELACRFTSKKIKDSYLIVAVLFILGRRCISLQVVRSGGSIDF